MKSLDDLKITNFDYLIAKDDQVALRYSAQGSHSGEPYKSFIHLIKKQIKFIFLILIKIFNQWDEKLNGQLKLYSN